jgi:ATP-binding cassette, subfamily B, bacterial MsbA
METRGASLIGRLARECLRFPGRLLGAAGCVVLLRLAQLGLTWVAKLWVEALTALDPSPMGRVLAAMTAFAALMAAALVASRLLVASLTQALLERLRNAAVDRLLGLDLPRARARASGDSIARVFHDAGILGGFVDFAVLRILGDGLLAVGAIGMMFYLQWRLALLTCVLVPLVGLLLSSLGGVIRRRSSSAQKQIGSPRSPSSSRDFPPSRPSRPSPTSPPASPPRAPCTAPASFPQRPSPLC